MPHIELFFFKDDDGSAPFVDWLYSLDRKVVAKCTVRIRRLEERGQALRRPEADYLRDGIYELRVRHQRVNYRILYFFSGRGVVVVSHGLTKEKAVPVRDIDRAIARKEKVEADFERYTTRPGD